MSTLGTLNANVITFITLHRTYQINKKEAHDQVVMSSNPRTGYFTFIFCLYHT